MLTISNTRAINPQISNQKQISFGSEYVNKSSDNSNILRNSLIALAFLGMASCSEDLDDVHFEKATKTEIQTKTDSINSHRSIDEYMQDLGFLQDGNRLGDVETMYFEDMQGTKHYLEKGDSTKIVDRPNGIKFHGIDIDKDGNRQEYDMKFEKYHKGLIVTKDMQKPDEEGRDTLTYRLAAKTDGSYILQKASGKGIIFYYPIATVRKTSGGLLFEGYDWVKEQRTDDIEVLQNFQNNVAMPKEEY